MKIDYSKLPDEGFQIEYKSNTKKLSKDIWETISAFENGMGGIIFLGIDQKVLKDGNTQSKILGVDGEHQMLDDFWSSIDEIISYSTIRQDDIHVIELGDKKIIEIHVNSAPDASKPVYAHGIPFVRKGAVDKKAKRNDLKLLITNSSDSLDTEVLHGFSIDELDLDSVLSYKSKLIAREKYSTYKNLSLPEFLKRIGVISKDFEGDKTEGITAGGLLFFVKNNAIIHKFPNFQLEYFDESVPTERWVSRISSITDNLNIYTFFINASESIFRTVNNNFQLENGITRKDTSGSMIVALREALINMLMHANYYDSEPLRATTHINFYEFVNPGKMKIPVSEFFTTNRTSTRNPIISKLFIQLGLGERAGHGGEKIFDSAILNNYRKPEIKTNSTETRLKIWKVDYADSFSGKEISDRERKILKAIISSPNQQLSHKEIESKTELSYSKVTRSLTSLKDKELIETIGNARTTRYVIPASREQVMAQVQAMPNLLRKIWKSQNE